MTKTKVNIHSNEIFIKATEVAEIMDVSRAYSTRKRTTFLSGLCMPAFNHAPSLFVSDIP